MHSSLQSPVKEPLHTCIALVLSLFEKRRPVRSVEQVELVAQFEPGDFIMVMELS